MKHETSSNISYSHATAPDCGVADGRRKEFRLTLSAVLLTTAIALSACSSVEIQRGKSLATVGVQYSKATTALVDTATDAMINSDSEALVRSKLPPAALSQPGFSAENLRARLEQSNKGLVENTALLLSLRASLSTVESYFTALQSLVDNPQSEATAAAVATLSDRVNALNKVLNAGAGPAKPVISDAQKSALSSLSKLVADQVHGAIVAHALRRDAPVIGEALLLQEMVWSVAAKIVSGALTDQTNRFYVDSVSRPFEKQEIGAAWVGDRNKYIKARAIGETSKEIQAARAASVQMNKTWEKILSGVYDTSEMRQQIAELEALVSAIVAVKEAEKPKAPAQ